MKPLIAIYAFALTAVLGMLLAVVAGIGTAQVVLVVTALAGFAGSIGALTAAQDAGGTRPVSGAG